uniref:BZIP domain-containing protein n=1 Tax=Zeugodacus cucurbitae TaxID=28588 RepID=A0A0A1WWM6_ZEUCU
MDLSMCEASENCLYRHKKFDQGKRPREEDVLQDLEQLNGARSTAANALLLNPYFCGVERVSTPFSTDSNCSSDYVGFVSRFNASSTPSSKRRRLLSGGQYGGEDSGIALTPKKQTAADESQPREQLKRQLKLSALAQPPKKKQKVTDVQQAGGIAAKQNYTTPTKRHNSSTSGIGVNSTHNNIPGNTAINASTNTSAVSNANTSANKNNRTNLLPNKSVTPVIANSIKTVLKPTVVGTLELPTTVGPVASNSGQQLDTSVVLSRIGEDKLRSICTYHTNMVRTFPKKERSPKDQERRNKNTIACRMSRRVKKLEQIALEEECKEFEAQELAMTEDMLRATAYLEQLELLIAGIQSSDDEESEIDVVNVGDENDASVVGIAAGAAPRLPQANALPSHSSRSSAFTIASLLGNNSSKNA